MMGSRLCPITLRNFNIRPLSLCALFAFTDPCCCHFYDECFRSVRQSVVLPPRASPFSTRLLSRNGIAHVPSLGATACVGYSGDAMDCHHPSRRAHSRLLPDRFWRRREWNVDPFKFPASAFSSRQLFCTVPRRASSNLRQATSRFTLSSLLVSCWARRLQMRCHHSSSPRCFLPGEKCQPSAACTHCTARYAGCPRHHNADPHALWGAILQGRPK